MPPSPFEFVAAEASPGATAAASPARGPRKRLVEDGVAVPRPAAKRSADEEEWRERMEAALAQQRAMFADIDTVSLTTTKLVP